MDAARCNAGPRELGPAAKDALPALRRLLAREPKPDKDKAIGLGDAPLRRDIEQAIRKIEGK